MKIKWSMEKYIDTMTVITVAIAATLFPLGLVTGAGFIVYVLIHGGH